MLIRALEERDWPAVRAIFEERIAVGDATFEVEAPSWAEWDADHLASPRLVAEADGRVVGWAALTPFSRRPCYRGVAEGSIYVAAGRRGRGAGSALLARLVAESEEGGLWTLQAGIFPENIASIALHRRCGFRVVGVRERLGRGESGWRDVVLMERRSERW